VTVGSGAEDPVTRTPEPAAASATAAPDDVPATEDSFDVEADDGSLRRALPSILRLRWVPLTAALLSLVLSLTSIYVSTRQPEVLLILPDVVRIAGGHKTGASYLYLQPAFVSTGNNDRVEVIRGMRLTAQHDGGSAPVELAWREQVRFVTNAAGTLEYQHDADAVPLLISPRTAAAPIALFQAPAGWFVDAGTYRFTLIGERVVGGDEMRADFSVTVRAEDAPVLAETSPERFITYPIR